MAEDAVPEEVGAPRRAGRYELRKGEEGPVLECHDSPGISVRVDPGLGLSESEARKLGTRVILLDGAGQFGPLYDNEQQLYNLDHHRGCVRSITLSTCEQALLLVAQDLPLDSADWTIFASTPDLDTVLAIWVLLNHRRIRGLPEDRRDVLLPLLRAEGAIDANGAEVARFCGLPDAARQAAEQRLARLQEQLRNLSRQELPPTELAMALLLEVDRVVLGDDTLATLPAVEKSYGHIDLGAGQVAVVCGDRAGIYAVEPRLKERWGQRLGMIALENAPGQYTLRRVSVLKPLNLTLAYERLNLIDRAVDGRPPEKSWGGSDDIGGSPRPGGSALQPAALLEALHDLYGPARTHPIARALRTVVATGLLVLLSMAAATRLGHVIDAPALPPAALELGLLALSVGILARIAIWPASRRRSFTFGLRRPAHGWSRALLLLPVLAPLAWAGAGWIPHLPATVPAWADLALLLGSLVLAQGAAEILFRGLAHGLMLFAGPVSDPLGRWRLSRATWLSAALYAGSTAFVSGLWTEPPPLALPAAAAAAGAAGLILGLLRERVLSLWPGALVQILATSAAAGARLFVG